MATTTKSFQDEFLKQNNEKKTQELIENLEDLVKEIKLTNDSLKKLSKNLGKDESKEQDNVKDIRESNASFADITKEFAKGMREGLLGALGIGKNKPLVDASRGTSLIPIEAVKPTESDIKSDQSIRITPLQSEGPTEIPSGMLENRQERERQPSPNIDSIKQIENVKEIVIETKDVKVVSDDPIQVKESTQESISTPKYEILDPSKESTNIGKEIKESFKLSFKTYESLLNEIKELKKAYENTVMLKDQNNDELERKRAQKEEDADMLATAIANKLSDVLGSNMPVDIDLPDRSNIPGAPEQKPKPDQPKSRGPMGGGRTGKLLGAGLAVEAGFAAYDVAQIEKLKEEGQISEKDATVKQVGAAGGLAGAGTLGAFGAGFGSAFGPVGTVLGGVGGALLGGYLGKEGSEALANTVMNLFTTSNEKAIEKQTEKVTELQRVTEEQRMLNEDKVQSGTGLGGNNVITTQQNFATQNTTVTSTVKPQNEHPTWLNYSNSRYR